MADLLFYHCLLSPLPRTTIPCLLLSSNVLYITHFYTQLLHDYIFPHNSSTLQAHTHSYLLSCAYLRFWFGFGQGMFAVFLVLSSQYRKGAARLIIVCESAWGKKRQKERIRGRDVEIARFYYIDRTSWWDLWCFSLLCLARGFMIPLCCFETEEGETLTHLFITLSLILHLAGIPTVASDSAHRLWFAWRVVRYFWHYKVSRHFWVTWKIHLWMLAGKESSECHKQHVKHVRFPERLPKNSKRHLRLE